ncbi:hypothetical protein [Janthinobacterium sp. NKUCC08_JDC]|uniref:hypothetical protein n=1 Tax=Janthinobacterium sp. NKUCC08_JDC TaxID=2842122 RepID=UPI001C5B21A4|nr:hypothetical protein [Janthinobacterium sp. NKUCC08_JDC]MBW3499875.1 hypothetical protein [Janthinobacterium sp. NKUCC08_JDC]
MSERLVQCSDLTYRLTDFPVEPIDLLPGYSTLGHCLRMPIMQLAAGCGMIAAVFLQACQDRPPLNGARQASVIGVEQPQVRMPA